MDQSSERVSISGVLKTSLDCAKEALLTLSALTSQNSPLQWSLDSCLPLIVDVEGSVVLQLVVNFWFHLCKDAMIWD